VTEENKLHGEKKTTNWNVKRTMSTVGQWRADVTNHHHAEIQQE